MQSFAYLSETACMLSLSHQHLSGLQWLPVFVDIAKQQGAVAIDGEAVVVKRGIAIVYDRLIVDGKNLRRTFMRIGL